MPVDFSSPLPPISDLSGMLEEKQITRAPCGHTLTNINAWTADGEWLVYDLRVDDNFTATRIEMVRVATGEVRLIYESVNGACCGVVTTSPVEPKVVFMHGPEHPAPDWTYGMTRRRGMVVDLRHLGRALPLDAMNYAPPFAPGALRGGSHLHVFSPDGALVSFTYEDEVLARSAMTDGDHDPNQRNLGVAGPGGPIQIAHSHPRNHDGNWFSVVVTRTTARPRPGSDEISRAFEEGWIGRVGYVRADGTQQKRALSFQGLVATADGREYPEIFVVDLPEGSLAVAESGRPLEGTDLRYPAPPRGVSQRRLTFTGGRKFPGVARAPRHWTRSSPDGSQIVFLMLDDAGHAQFWSVRTATGELHQISWHPWGVESTFTLSFDGTWIGHVMDGSIFLTDVVTGRAVRLTTRRTDVGAPLPQACVFSPDGKWLAYTRPVNVGGQEFAQIFCVAVPVV